MKTMLPLFLLSLLLLSLAALAGGRGVSIELRFPQTVAIKNRPLFGLLAVLFVLCLLSVFRLLPYGLLLLLFLTLLGPARPQLLKKADFGLLATFVCFFIFAGNLGRLPQIRQFLESLLSGDVLLTSLAASQFISNVPAAVLLSGFTQDWQGLLLGTNIGGLGTPVASLASLISFKLYLKSEKASPRRYLLLFSLANLLGLSLLLLFVRLIGQW